MATLKGFWEQLHPVWTGIIGGTLIVGGGLLFAIILDIMDGSAANWKAMKGLLIFAWILGMVVVTLASYKIPPEVAERIDRLKAGHL